MLGATVLIYGDSTVRVFPTGLVYVLIIACLIFIVNIAMAIWTSVDAQKNSSYSKVLWALVVIFGGIFGFILYLIIGRDTT